MWCMKLHEMTGVVGLAYLSIIDIRRKELGEEAFSFSFSWGYACHSLMAAGETGPFCSGLYRD